MTVVCWDGTTLAADKRCSFGSSFATVTKIRRINGNLVGCAGDAAQCRELMAWAETGFAKDTIPPKQLTDACSVLCITPAGAVHHYGSSHIPQVIEDRYFAIGSGADYATAAIHLGYDSIKAVKVAIDLDPGCGNGVDALVLRYELTLA